MDIQSKEGLDEFFKFIEFNSNDIQITLGTCSQIFDTLSNDLFAPIYKSNLHINGGVNFYKLMYEEVKYVTNYMALKNAIVSIFYFNGESEFFKTNSTLVLACMKMVINCVWQQCLKYTPRIELIAPMVIKCDNDDEGLRRLMIHEFKFIVSDIEKERNITFPVPEKIDEESS
jgi:hypothetical protein